ncbi:alkaline phytoceramidase [bacterium AH-315-F18]|nr:alkaline phytoceramidase [bacterium AH-315-F18]
MKNRNTLIFIIFTVIAIGSVPFLPRMPQDPTYHAFADERGFFGILRFGDVVSNLPFVVVGCMGLWFLFRRGAATPGGPYQEPWERYALFAAFLGLLLTGFGSAYYHHVPDNARLVWDRAPLTLVFMSFLAITVGDRVSPRAGAVLLFPLLVIGVSSVFYWDWTESRGLGDLRAYGVVQFYTLLAIPLLCLLHPPRYTRGRELLIVVCIYGVAKVCEALDATIYEAGHLVSGHTLKHLIAGCAAWTFLNMLQRRVPVDGAIGSGEVSENQGS